MRRGSIGFTLIELMLVVVIIGVLSAIAVPKFSDLLRKSKEGATRGNLGRLRSALNIYYADMEGWYPRCTWQSNSSVLSRALVPKCIDRIPNVHTANFHAPLDDVFCHQLDDSRHDGEGWAFHGELSTDYGANQSTYGSIWIFCTHTDSKKSQWRTY